MRLLSDTLGLDFMFLDDNAKQYRPEIVDDFTEEENNHHMNWQSRSPDRNPIEQFWDGLAKDITQHLSYYIPSKSIS